MPRAKLRLINYRLRSKEELTRGLEDDKSGRARNRFCPQPGSTRLTILTLKSGTLCPLDLPPVRACPVGHRGVAR